MIPLVSGDLSVEWWLQRLRGEAGPAPGATREAIAGIAALGGKDAPTHVSAVEDCLAWAALEPKEGELDWSFPRANAQLAKEHGLRYVVQPWLHVAPAWFLAKGDFAGFRCLEHGSECAWPSLFAPSTFAAFERFYDELKRALAESIDGIVVAFPADLGDVGYPAGFGAWKAALPPKRDHVHPGFWAADPHASAAYRKHAAGRSPEPDAALAARDFADFYVGALNGFVDRLLAAVRSRFPTTPLWIKLGRDPEPLARGVDPTALAAIAARHRAGIRAAQRGREAPSTLPSKRLAAACRRHTIALGSESAPEAGRETLPARLFDDATSGAAEWFAWPEQLVGARELLGAHPSLLDGAPSRCDVALVHASHLLRRRPDLALPPVLSDLAEPLRDRFDFDLVDESLIDGGALKDVAVVGLLEAEDLSGATQQELASFVERGGSLVVGPDVESARMQGPLADLVARAPPADDFVELGGTAAPSLRLELGSARDLLLLAGAWYTREEGGAGGRFTGPSASAFLPIARGTRHLLEIECFVDPRTAHLDHGVFADGTRLGTLRRAGLQRFAVWLPADTRREVVEVALVSAPFRPADTDPAGDPRELGVAVLSLQLTQEGAPDASFAAAAAPELAGRVRADLLQENGTLAHGKGQVVVSRRRPLVKLLALLDHAVRTRSEWGRLAPRDAGSGEPLPGLRATRFEEKVVLFNRTAAEKEVVLGDDATRPPVVVPAGGLVALDLRSGRILA
jgi:hypothetical protein